ncbi:LOW QUALITY PROTEIN: hypothetical protein T265_14315 [Opisthorchis viverrini]|uniref:Uncharacterized protein n=1 Tax=Opisthorchis viverrini TaxID=6198 RepID=A0A074ZCM1_OPIVI|nr:LOW QUALITY PROTEIN: hypothetical protein T265_14315 [Opisthorchis viverrini]KER24913.1 LOW QUALITY PROTEIN: hypothetical protein T265_14315 [Opisthorchis viverrini]
MYARETWLLRTADVRRLQRISNKVIGKPVSGCVAAPSTALAQPCATHDKTPSIGTSFALRVFFKHKQHTSRRMTLKEGVKENTKSLDVVFFIRSGGPIGCSFYPVSSFADAHVTFELGIPRRRSLVDVGVTFVLPSSGCGLY